MKKFWRINRLVTNFYMAKKDISIRDLAEALDEPYHTIRKEIEGSQKVTTEQLYRIADAIGIEAAELICEPVIVCSGIKEARALLGGGNDDTTGNGAICD